MVTRGRWIYDAEKGELVPAHEYVRPVGKRSKLSAPMLIADTMEPCQSMLDGKMYDSKAALRATYKAAGVTEVGNDVSFKRPERQVDRKGIQAAVGRALSQAGLGA